jgi:phenylacetate-CoA ligase
VGYAGDPPSLATLSDRVADSVEASVGVRPEVELVPNADLLKLGPPHKIPRVAKR